MAVKSVNIEILADENTESLRQRAEAVVGVYNDSGREARVAAVYWNTFERRFECWIEVRS